MIWLSAEVMRMSDYIRKFSRRLRL
jgi:hypothetical protein